MADAQRIHKQKKHRSLILITYRKTTSMFSCLKSDLLETIEVLFHSVCKKTLEMSS